MLRNTFKRGVGIVHGSSNTGEYNKDQYFFFLMRDIILIVVRAVDLRGADRNSRTNE